MNYTLQARLRWWESVYESTVEIQRETLYSCCAFQALARFSLPLIRDGESIKEGAMKLRLPSHRQHPGLVDMVVAVLNRRDVWAYVDTRRHPGLSFIFDYKAHCCAPCREIAPPSYNDYISLGNLESYYAGFMVPGARVCKNGRGEKHD